MDATISWTCRYISEILARPKHYQSSWMSTLAVPATDKTTNSVSPLCYESPCWLHLPDVGSFLCQLLHDCKELMTGVLWGMHTTSDATLTWTRASTQPQSSSQSQVHPSQYAILQMMMAKWSSSHCYCISLSSGIWARMWLLSSVLSECTCFSIPS